jgi:hypothetical protein
MVHIVLKQFTYIIIYTWRWPCVIETCRKLSGDSRTVLYLRRLVAGFKPRRPGFETRSGQVGFVVNKVALGQVCCEYFGFPCQYSFHRLLHSHHHLLSRAGTIGQLVADVPSGLSLTPPQEKKKTGDSTNDRRSCTENCTVSVYMYVYVYPLINLVQQDNEIQYHKLYGINKHMGTRPWKVKVNKQ